MNFQIVILLSVAACALALPLPDEEVSVLQKASEMASEAVTGADGLLKKSEAGLSTVEEGLNAIVSNATAAAEDLPKTDVESKLAKIADEVKEAARAVEDEIQEVPKSLPVKAREETEPVVPPFAGVRAEPKEGVEIGEAKSTASSPGADETNKNAESKTTSDPKPSTETTTSASSEKKTEAPASEDKPTEATAQSKTTVKPEVTGEKKITTETPKANPDSKPTEAPKEKHAHSSEANKSDESAESKESEESNESNKSK